MAFMRWAKVPQRRVAPPIYLSMALIAAVTTALCAFVPEWF